MYLFEGVKKMEPDNYVMVYGKPDDAKYVRDFLYYHMMINESGRLYTRMGRPVNGVE